MGGCASNEPAPPAKASGASKYAAPPQAEQAPTTDVVEAPVVAVDAARQDGDPAAQVRIATEDTDAMPDWQSALDGRDPAVLARLPQPSARKSRASRSQSLSRSGRDSLRGRGSFLNSPFGLKSPAIKELIRDSDSDEFGDAGEAPRTYLLAGESFNASSPATQRERIENWLSSSVSESTVTAAHDCADLPPLGSTYGSFTGDLPGTVSSPHGPPPALKEARAAARTPPDSPTAVAK